MKVKTYHKKGNHLILDGYSNKNLDDKKEIKKFLNKTVKQIKMKALSKPYVKKYNAPVKSESGITGTIILAESNITIHTYPQKKWFALDIFSCKEFNINKTLKYLKKELGITNYKSKLLRRGI